MDVEWDVTKKLQLVATVDDDNKQKVLYESLASLVVKLYFDVEH